MERLEFNAGAHPTRESRHMRKHIARGGVVAAAVVLVVATLASAHTDTLRATASSSCVMPTGTVSNKALLHYDSCRFDELSDQIAGLGSVTPTPTPTPTPSDTVTSTPTPSETSSAPAATGFPTAETAGLPRGWTPKTVHNGELDITTPGAVVTDMQVNGEIIVKASNVTLNRVFVNGGRIENEYAGVCHNGLLVENSLIKGVHPTSDTDPPALGTGGYTAINVKIDDKPEGFRDGGNVQGCTQTTIKDSWAHITPPDDCTDWHGDALQAYGGPPLVVRNTYLNLDGGSDPAHDCYGTAPFFVPLTQDNRSADIDGLIVDGSAGYMFRDGVPSTVNHVYVVDGTWIYWPIVDAYCPNMKTWDVHVATLDANGQPVPGRAVECTGDGH